MMPEHVDIEFAHAVRAAAKGQGKARKVRLQAGEALDAWLRSGAALGAAEREMLADLDAGRMRPVTGRGAALSELQQRYYAARYVAGGADKRALADVVDATGMDRATVLGWVRSLRRGLASAPDQAEVLRQIIEQHEQDRPETGE